MLFQDAINGKNFKCDGCKKTITGESIKLKPASNNINIKSFTQGFLFVDKKGIIISGYDSPDGNIGDLVMHCPICEHPHLWGFDSA